MAQEILLTKEGFERKTAKLEHLERQLYQEIPERLKDAKEHGGDLRENKEYIYLKEEQEFMGTVTADKIREAQADILAILREMDERGELVMIEEDADASAA